MALEPLESLPQDSTVSSRNRTPIAILGLLLMFPALLCWITTLVIPTLQTIQLSQQKLSILSGQSQAVGMANYNFLFQDATFYSAQTFTITLALERFAIVALVPLLLALALNEFGRIVRIPT